MKSHHHSHFSGRHLHLSLVSYKNRENKINWYQMDINRTLSPALIHQMIWRGGCLIPPAPSVGKTNEVKMPGMQILLFYVYSKLFSASILQPYPVTFISISLSLFKPLHLEGFDSYHPWKALWKATSDGGVHLFPWRLLLKGTWTLQLKQRFSHTHFCHQEGMSLPPYLGNMLSYNQLSSYDYVDPQM